MDVQLAHLLDTADFSGVLEEIFKLMSVYYPGESELGIRNLHRQVQDLFDGNYSGYRACTVEYHDFQHTSNILLTAARILDGYNIVGRRCPLDLASALLQATLLHDTGYIQKMDDSEGTGAKYTHDHEARSISFVEENSSRLEISGDRAETIKRLILSTDLKSDFELISFASSKERDMGAVLGSADLLGQMADRAYLEKLLFLYYEFREAGVPGYETEFDVLRKTQDFYQIVRQRLQDTYLNLSDLISHHFSERFGVEENLYMKAIDRQMEYLDTIISDEGSNFRHKLKRGDQQKLHQVRS